MPSIRLDDELYKRLEQLAVAQQGDVEETLRQAVELALHAMDQREEEPLRSAESHRRALEVLEAFDGRARMDR